MNLVEEIQNLLEKGNKYSIPVLLQDMQSLINRNTYSTDEIMSDMIDKDFLDEVKNLIAYENIPVYFGKTLRDLKCVILDENLREHTLFIKYRGLNKLVVASVNLPHSPLQDGEYNSLEEIIVAFRKHIDTLSGYFYELERIDRFCTIMEPTEPSFKDDYRRILLDDRIWLHLEVTSDGLATNIHLVGQSELWSNKLQQGLLLWDHDKEIIENIMTVFDMVNFPVGSRKSSTTTMSDDKPMTEATLCSICLCVELPDSTGVPLPLCQNPPCGVSFHRNCLFQWLVACGGGRPPPFGVATGSCPACLDPIACCERDD